MTMMAFQHMETDFVVHIFGELKFNGNNGIDRDRQFIFLLVTLLFSAWLAIVFAFGCLELAVSLSQKDGIDR